MTTSWKCPQCGTLWSSLTRNIVLSRYSGSGGIVSAKASCDCGTGSDGWVPQN